ncbi:PQQ-binding-like beta-propeller repeat protein [Streptomyces sp. NBC_00091]|uniref:outer membrane protein assembly factor BamB family protein n=1 Tax=Streptomyces sp. NBC_00091 TaxID=2975648 RepID=UPI00225ABD06|nr:PQQ-binding-like beta-propeller repeat protein [Streptomyces sp. NBC_00091]MCX5376846.1 PQQ-like beta-propeller repeat protein [Streptomyces sp. NBC_00091]
MKEKLFGVGWLVGTAALGAVTLMYFVLFWKLSFVDMPGNECGSDDCPRGMGWLMLFTPALGFLTWLLWQGVKEMQELRRSCLVRLIAAVLAPVALWPGWLGYEWMRGPQMYVSGWQIPDGSGKAKPVGVWGLSNPVPGMFVRARVDGLVAFDGTGRRGWGLAAPEGTGLCALSRTTPSGIGLLSYEGGTGGCGSQVAAVELGEGRSLWKRDASQALVAAVGDTAVLAEPNAVTGLGLREGGERWRAPVARDCLVRAVDGAGERAVYVEECRAGATARLVSVDARTGARAWEAALPTVSRLGEVRVLSADPLAVHVKDTQRGTDVVLLFDAQGRERGRLPGGDLYGEPLVTGDLLVSPVKAGKKADVSAYSLIDGHRVWRTGFGDERILGLAPGRSPGEIAVVGSVHGWTYLTRLGRADGKRREESTILREVRLGNRFAFSAGPPGSYVFVNLDANDELQPTFEVMPVWGW